MLLTPQPQSSDPASTAKSGIRARPGMHSANTALAAIGKKRSIKHTPPSRQKDRCAEDKRSNPYSDDSYSDEDNNSPARPRAPLKKSWVHFRPRRVGSFP